MTSDVIEPLIERWEKTLAAMESASKHLLWQKLGDNVWNGLTWVLLVVVLLVVVLDKITLAVEDRVTLLAEPFFVKVMETFHVCLTVPFLDEEWWRKTKLFMIRAEKDTSF